MSWSINTIGSPRAVKHVIDSSPYMPPVLKAAAKAIIDENTAKTDKLVHFESYGHVGGGTGSIGNLRIETVDLAVEPVTIEDLPKPAAAASA